MFLLLATRQVHSMYHDVTNLLRILCNTLKQTAVTKMICWQMVVTVHTAHPHVARRHAVDAKFGCAQVTEHSALWCKFSPTTSQSLLTYSLR